MIFVLRLINQLNQELLPFDIIFEMCSRVKRAETLVDTLFPRDFVGVRVPPVAHFFCTEWKEAALCELIAVVDLSYICIRADDVDELYPR